MLFTIITMQLLLTLGGNLSSTRAFNALENSFAIKQTALSNTSRKFPRCTILSMGLIVEKDEKSVGVALCKILETEFRKSMSRKGNFVFAISGGSMLKMLSNLGDSSVNEIDWSKCTMGFVSHRCVGLDDDAATYHKAKPLFLDSWISKGLQVVTVSGSTDAEREAILYEECLRSLPENVLPWNSEGFPVFELLLIGVGTDGHVGSIYPNLPDTESQRIIVPVTQPASKPVKISLSLKSMLASKASVVACAGKSAKAPLGKAEAMVRGLEGADETAMSFPASVLRNNATWLIDEDSAVLLNSRTLN